GAVDLDTLESGQLGGYVVEASGAAVPGAMVTVEHAGWTERTRTDGAGRWLITTVPSGRVKIRVESNGFRVLLQEIDYDRAHPRRLSFRLLVGAANETVEVTSNASILNKESQQIEKQARQNAALKDVEASVNVAELQKRVVGVLPIAVNVP